MNYLEELQWYIPKNGQERRDLEVIKQYINSYPDTILTRENVFAHMTAASMIFNEDRKKVLMVYHNIYQSWSWTGGHADGDTDLLQTAVREAIEETGATSIKPISEKLAAIDILPVWGHVKNGSYVSSHLHLNLTYILQAEETDFIRVKEDENSAVKWIKTGALNDYVTERDMIPVYQKMLAVAQGIITKNDRIIL